MSVLALIDKGSELVAHIPCVRCRFDLFQRAGSGACPECALPLERSLQPDRMLFWADWRRVVLLLGTCGWIVTMLLPLVQWTTMFLPIRALWHFLGFVLAQALCLFYLCSILVSFSPEKDWKTRILQVALAASGAIWLVGNPLFISSIRYTPYLGAVPAVPATPPHPVIWLIMGAWTPATLAAVILIHWRVSRLLRAHEYVRSARVAMIAGMVAVASFLILLFPNSWGPCFFFGVLGAMLLSLVAHLGLFSLIRKELLASRALTWH